MLIADLGAVSLQICSAVSASFPGDQSSRGLQGRRQCCFLICGLDGESLQKQRNAAVRVVLGDELSTAITLDVDGCTIFHKLVGKQ